jgi:glutathione-regulated potassium-efflux system ancillary protein KefG
MTKTLVLLFHPDLSKSNANEALAKAAIAVEGVEIIDMSARYPDGKIDMVTGAERDAQMLLDADRIVLQFPIQWYSTPALLKAWQDAVLTRMYYLFAKTEGARLAGTPLMVAATAGNVCGAYARNGQNYYSIDEIFTPLKATAHRCALPWHDPYVVFAADKLSDDALTEVTSGYVEALRAFSTAKSSRITTTTA